VQVTAGDDDDNKITNKDGLIWIGLRPIKAAASFEAQVVRPADSALDAMFSTETAKQSVKYMFEDKCSTAYSMEIMN